MGGEEEAAGRRREDEAATEETDRLVTDRQPRKGWKTASAGWSSPRSQFTERFDLREKGPSDTPERATPPTGHQRSHSKGEIKKRGKEEVKKLKKKQPLRCTHRL